MLSSDVLDRATSFVISTDPEDINRKNTHYGHFEVTEFVPEIFNGVYTDEGGYEETDELDAAIDQSSALDRYSNHT